MGEKSHSEHYFCCLSIRLLNTIKQGKKEFSSLELGGARDTVLQQKPWHSLNVCGAARAAHRLAAWEGLEGDRDKAWILVTRLIKDLFQP